MNTVVISKVDGSIRDAFKQGDRIYYYLTEETIEQTFVITEQVYDLSKLTAAQLKGLLKNCLVKPVTELPKPAGYDQWVADGKPTLVIPSITIDKAEIAAFINRGEKGTPRNHRDGYNRRGEFVACDQLNY